MPKEILMQPNPEEDSEAILDTPTPRETVAVILFDSLTQPFEGARGATDARQVVLRAEEFDIHLKISTNPSQHQIIGQVFARTEKQFLSSIRLSLMQDGKPLRTTDRKSVV